MLGRSTPWLCALLAAIGCACSAAPDATPEDTSSSDEAVDGCSARTEIILWTENTWLLPVAKNFNASLPCTHYYIGVSLLASDKTSFHASVKNEIDAIHALGPNFHALAEFHWGGWGQWVRESPGTRDWHMAGVEFRKKMDAAGFTLFSGNSDSWLINELPSTIVADNGGVSRHLVRGHAESAVAGLFDGGGVRKKGVVARAGVGSTPNMGMDTDKARLEDFLSDGAFWNNMSKHVRWWAEEVYADPHDVCVGSATVAERAQHLDDYLFHAARLAEAGPASAAPARAFFAKTFTPFLNGAWRSNAGYGDLNISEANMSAFISQQVYSVHAFGEKNAVPGSRIAWSWTPNHAAATEPEIDALGKRLAHSLNDAYTHGSSYACSPSGAYTFCQCDVAGAKFNEGWGKRFGSW